MRRVPFLLLALFTLAVTPSESYALAADYSKAQLKTKGVFADQMPVHGYWVNWEDVFWYAGDDKAFNQFTQAYAKFKHVQLKVVLHAGEKSASSPWDKEPRNLPADWSLYVWNSGTPLDAAEPPRGKPAPTRLDVWIGKRLQLKDLRIPDGIEVAAGTGVADDSEIAKFVASRRGK